MLPASVLRSTLPGLLLLAGLVAGVRGTSKAVEPQDADGWMRLVRVERLHATGAWYDGSEPRANAPFGTTSHWTRPYDLLLLAGGWGGTPLWGFSRALWLWSGWLGPLLMAGLLVALVAAARVLQPPSAWVFLPVLAVLRPSVLAYFWPGRGDHHALVLLLLVVLLAAALRTFQDPSRNGPAAVAGLALALGLWNSVEGLVAAAAFGATGVVLYLREGPPVARGAARVFGWATFGGGVALLLERPFDALLELEPDRLSAAHLLPLLLATVGSAVASRMGQRAAARVPLVAVGIVVASVVVLLATPGLLAGPHANVPSDALVMWEGLVAENQPLVGTHVTPGQAALSVLAWVPSLLGAFMLPSLLRGPRGRAWTVVLVFALAYVPLAFFRLRFAPHAELILLFPFAAALGGAFSALGSRPGVAGSAAAAGILLLGLGLGPLAALARVRVERPAHPTSSGEAALDPVLALLEREGTALRPAGAAAIVLAPIDVGPELLYRTGLRVVATPYHRNAAGIVDALTVLRGRDSEAACRVLVQRGVDLLLVRAGSEVPWMASGEGLEPPCSRPRRLAGAGGTAWEVYRVPR